ncbi:hypothetical protein HHK36_016898 [Tetracentron sinense]|uniref:Uncharacterized protein n=1 Tax=Tetracentron sinense TaxID=13715 RepID=A0A834Z6N2_TETSI|nr:hypothetical protein HHK36_016898 [Tetracentron sinense]
MVTISAVTMLIIVISAPIIVIRGGKSLSNVGGVYNIGRDNIKANTEFLKEEIFEEFRETDRVSLSAKRGSNSLSHLYGYLQAIDMLNMSGAMDPKIVQIEGKRISVQEVEARGGRFIKIVERSKKGFHNVAWILDEAVGCLLSTISECIQGERGYLFRKFRGRLGSLLGEKRANGRGEFFSLSVFQGNNKGDRIIIPRGYRDGGWRRFQEDVGGSSNINGAGETVRAVAEQEEEDVAAGVACGLGPFKAAAYALSVGPSSISPLSFQPLGPIIKGPGPSQSVHRAFGELGVDYIILDSVVGPPVDTEDPFGLDPIIKRSPFRWLRDPKDGVRSKEQKKGQDPVALGEKLGEQDPIRREEISPLLRKVQQILHRFRPPVIPQSREAVSCSLEGGEPRALRGCSPELDPLLGGSISREPIVASSVVVRGYKGPVASIDIGGQGDCCRLPPLEGRLWEADGVYVEDSKPDREKFECAGKGAVQILEAGKAASVLIHASTALLSEGGGGIDGRGSPQLGGIVYIPDGIYVTSLEWTINQFLVLLGQYAGSFVVVDESGRDKALESGCKVTCMVSQVLFESKFVHFRNLQNGLTKISKTTITDDSNGHLQRPTSQHEEGYWNLSDDDGVPPLEANLNRIRSVELHSVRCR